MIKITDKYNCCGCSACATICPKKCISMVADTEGFLYPQVNPEGCIECGLCEQVCNELHPFGSREPLKVLAAINCNEEIRLQSSSGGIFNLLTQKIISEGGVVFGARFDKDWQVVIDYADSMESAKAFMGSKYVQARMENAYSDAKRFLQEGRNVLFSGTPCQVAGLHKFLRKQYDNLLTVDFVCHGTPSPKVWKLYLDEIRKESKSIHNIEFRNKTNGWKDFSISFKLFDGNKSYNIISSFKNDLYMKAFLSDIILRPSCYHCNAKGCSSQSDITLADFWGIQTIFPDMDDDKGTSLVFINSEKGYDQLDCSFLRVKETTYNQVKSLNPSCYQSVLKNPKRDYFFTKLGKKKVTKLISECTRLSYKQQLRGCVSKGISLIKKILKGI